MEKLCNYIKCKNKGEFKGDFCDECSLKEKPYNQYAYKYWKSTPETLLKYRARIKLNTAKRRGKILQQPCEKCGQKAQAHHFDYNQPLNVRWLCILHHWEEHEILKQSV